jgi:hypothetical protein
MFFIEILLPWVMFLPSLFLHRLNAVLQALLQLAIISTGNYNFFNLLTINLCFAFLDDSFFQFTSKTPSKNKRSGSRVSVITLLVVLT